MAKKKQKRKNKEQKMREASRREAEREEFGADFCKFRYNPQKAHKNKRKERQRRACRKRSWLDEV